MRHPKRLFCIRNNRSIYHRIILGFQGLMFQVTKLMERYVIKVLTFDWWYGCLVLGSAYYTVGFSVWGWGHGAVLVVG